MKRFEDRIERIAQNDAPTIENRHSIRKPLDFIEQMR
jgi:hypothetical protein